MPDGTSPIGFRIGAGDRDHNCANYEDCLTACAIATAAQAHCPPACVDRTPADAIGKLLLVHYHTGITLPSRWDCAEPDEHACYRCKMLKPVGQMVQGGRVCKTCEAKRSAARRAAT